MPTFANQCLSIANWPGGQWQFCFAAGKPNRHDFSDAGGRVTSETDSGKLVTYSYDNDNQLTSVGGTVYSYDANANRTGVGYTTGPDNELTNDGTWTYTYDNQGNEIGKSNGTGTIWTYTYDNANEMTTTVESSGGTVVVQATYT